MGATQLLLLTILISSITVLSFVSFGFAAATKLLHPEEVKALKEIGKKVGKKDWDFKKDPCGGEGNWIVLDERKGFESSVTCHCSFNLNSSCHVVSMYVWSFSLSFLFWVFVLWLIFVSGLEYSSACLSEKSHSLNK